MFEVLKNGKDREEEELEMPKSFLCKVKELFIQLQPFNINPNKQGSPNKSYRLQTRDSNPIIAINSIKDQNKHQQPNKHTQYPH